MQICIKNNNLLEQLHLTNRRYTFYVLNTSQY
jgi:hypothetical protein